MSPAATSVWFAIEPGHLIAILGMDDSVVVHTPDGNLIC